MTTSCDTLLFEDGRVSLHSHHMPPGGQIQAETAPHLHVLVISGAPHANDKPLKAGTVTDSPAGHALTLSNPTGQPVSLLTFQWRLSDNTGKTEKRPPTEVRPWGSFTVLSDEADFKLKTLTVTPGCRLSLQRHEKREEHWFVIQGDATVTVEDNTRIATPGTYIHIPRHAWHRLANLAETPVEILEVQLGSYFGEDDIERRADDYGRQ